MKKIILLTLLAVCLFATPSYAWHHRGWYHPRVVIVPMFPVFPHCEYVTQVLHFPDYYSAQNWVEENRFHISIPRITVYSGYVEVIYEEKVCY